MIFFFLFHFFHCRFFLFVKGWKIMRLMRGAFWHKHSPGYFEVASITLRSHLKTQWILKNITKLPNFIFTINFLLYFAQLMKFWWNVLIFKEAKSVNFAKPYWPVKVNKFEECQGFWISLLFIYMFKNILTLKFSELAFSIC